MNVSTVTPTTSEGTSFLSANTEWAAGFLDRYFAALETNDSAQYAELYSNDMHLRVGDSVQAVDRDGAVATTMATIDRIHSLHHEIVNVWLQPGNVVLVESVATWSLRNGEIVPVPTCYICTVEGGYFTDMRIYADSSPLKSALEKERLK